MSVKHNGWTMKVTTADAYQSEGSAPEDMEDAYVMRNGRLAEVWDCGVGRVDGKVVLYGNWPADMQVDPNEPIYYSPPERWA